MNNPSEQTRLDEIRRRLSENAYFVNPHSDANVRDDVAFLLALLEKKDEIAVRLEKKGTVLSQQVMELTQEIENVRSDFDGRR